VLGHVRLDGSFDRAIVGERGAGEAALLQLVAPQPGAELVDGA